MNHSDSLPLVIAGPILRKVDTTSLTVWLVTTRTVDIKLNLFPNQGDNQSYELLANSEKHLCLQASANLYYQMVHLDLDAPLPYDCSVEYELKLRKERSQQQEWQDITQLMPHMLYPQQERLQFRIPSHVSSLLHGSCRKPHHSGPDGLVIADSYMEQILNQHSSKNRWPSMLMLSGDQIYADDVAGPMLHGIHQLLSELSFPSEKWDISPVDKTVITSDELYQHPRSYYERSQLLPYTEENNTLVDVLFGGARKPIFTSTDADNHLITLGEYLACYLLSWSPIPWEFISMDPPSDFTVEKKQRYRQESKVIRQFVSGLHNVQRVMAHLPVAMIMDDHDITDDFNLHRHWEETVYSHPLSKRMVGNGMLAYLINQAWGNNPNNYSQDLIQQVKASLNKPSTKEYDSLLDKLTKLEAWDFDWDTFPPLIVLDTRTRRWRSERSATQPSGLLDWEALTELQSRLSGHSSVLLVSAAPIFGVKFIEVVQRIVTFFGHPLAVDAEYWMAHPGTAYGILNVFRHRKTPHNFVVLSGDVHYSFVYDVELRGLKNSPHIWQICSSGLRNSFPERLLNTLDKINRWLYSPKSPLNWFTSRRKMRITPRKPLGAPTGRRLLNHAGIGLVELDEQGRPTKICQLIGPDKSVEFEKRHKESVWH